MSAEIFYLVGKPNHLKQELIYALRDKLNQETSITIPQVVTTDESVALSDNYEYVEERDFNLRNSMGMYCLTWEKNKYQYAVVADLIQRVNTGVDVILNGSMKNVQQARKQFPNLNIVVIKNQGGGYNVQPNQYLIAEEDEIKLEWHDSDDDMGQPYVLTMVNETSMNKAIEMLLNLVTYERNSYGKVV